MTKSRAIALRNVIDAVESDIDNGAEYVVQDPWTHELLSDKMAASAEKEMRAILRRLEERLAGNEPGR